MPTKQVGKRRIHIKTCGHVDDRATTNFLIWVLIQNLWSHYVSLANYASVRYHSDPILVLCIMWFSYQSTADVQSDQTQ
jgi:hypothetical protein